MPTGTPASGGSGSPLAAMVSMRAACSNARSLVRLRKTFRRGLSLSIRSKYPAARCAAFVRPAAISSRRTAIVLGRSTKFSAVIVSLGTSDFPLRLSPGGQCFALPFNDFGHLEERLVGLRRLLHDNSAVERRSHLVGAESSDRAARELVHLSEWNDIRRVQFIQLSHVVENRIQVAYHGPCLFRGKFQ